MPEAACAAADQLTLATLLRQAVGDLQRAGVEDAGNDARRLMGWVLGLSAAQLLGRPERTLSPEQAERFSRAIARRSAREPVSRIVGTRDFYGRTFSIAPATLDPRADSETLIEVVLELSSRDGRRTEPPRLLDVGTGSGCLLLTLLSELPHAVGVGTDISEAALGVARDNARRLGVDHRAQWLVRDVLEGIDGNFDILVSNPPYVRSAEIADLEPEVRLFDPHAALDGGDDGLHFFRRIAAGIPDVIPSGWIVLEVGHDQADAVVDILVSGACAIDSTGVIIRSDVARKRRCVAARTRH